MLTMFGSITTLNIECLYHEMHSNDGPAGYEQMLTDPLNSVRINLDDD